MECSNWSIRFMLLAVCLLPALVECRTRHYKFNVVMKNTTRLCSSKRIVTVNGRSPGPTLYAREDDTVLVKVVNHVKYNVSIHWLNGGNRDLESGFTLPVQSGKTYMLRLINAALNEELFFKIAGHKLTVVEVDAIYVKPFKTDTVLIAPGQTTNVLVTAQKNPGKYLIAASPFMDAPIAVDNMTATATLHYSGALANSPTTLAIPPPKNATAVANQFTNSLRSLNSKKFPAKVPLTVDHNLFLLRSRLLQAHFFNIGGVFCSISNKSHRMFSTTPGVWFMHCHLEVHTSWGLKMAFLVDNGKGPKESLLPPPRDLPKC
ncbi:MULTI-COPPER OXIDASE [Salix viminalis]|uniref:laccase n=1 Tax=Salix viminalis TaxID=40686 RepID=A0A9Q0V5U9_SALVM|nr:MULTI-COPPER OXIDASE [Salix viminalis]